MMGLLYVDLGYSISLAQKGKWKFWSNTPWAMGYLQCWKAQSSKAEALSLPKVNPKYPIPHRLFDQNFKNKECPRRAFSQPRSFSVSAKSLLSIGAFLSTITRSFLSCYCFFFLFFSFFNTRALLFCCCCPLLSLCGSSWRVAVCITGCVLVFWHDRMYLLTFAIWMSILSKFLFNVF